MLSAAAAAAAALRCFFIIKGNEQRQRCFCCVTALSSVSLNPFRSPPPLFTPFDKHYTQDIAFAFYTRYLQGSRGIMILCQQKKAWQIALSIYILVQNLSVCLSPPWFVSLLYIFSLSFLLSSLYLLSVFTTSVCPSFPLSSLCLLHFFCLSFVRLSLFCLTVCLSFCPYEHLYLRD